MSGGHFFYHDSSLCEEVTGYYPDYGLDTTSVKEDAKNAMRDNRLEDSQISELVFDVFCLLHSFDYYRSGDTSEDQYRKDIDYFKRKWFKTPTAADIQSIIDERLDIARKAVIRDFGYLIGGDDGK